jgi:oligopeptide transport system ATP-binding protein
MPEKNLLEVRDARVVVGAGGLLGAGRSSHTILHGVSLDVPEGGAVGVVGESGAGKTTLLRALLGLQALAGGSVTLGGLGLDGRRTRDQRRMMQMVFQDPYSSLNPRMTVGQTLGELLALHKVVERDAIGAECERLVELVGLSPSCLSRRPAAFSGGQRQRIAIARALAPRPRLLLADEPVSALDVSVQATVLKLLKSLQRDLGLSILLISHDLAVVRQFCDSVVVMRDGRVVEHGSVAEVFANPADAYTRELLSALPAVHAGNAGNAGGI